MTHPFSSQDKVIDFLRIEAKKQNWILKVILFGSRARGDFKNTSDYDVAIVTTAENNWPSWAIDMRERVPTLCGLDLIQLNSSTSKEL